MENGVSKQQEEEATQPSSCSQISHSQPSQTVEREISRKENLHGDLITIVKQQKPPKSRTKIDAKTGASEDSRNIKGKAISTSNHFEALNVANPEKSVCANFNAGRKEGNGSISNGPKLLVRKKRAMKEPPTIQPKVFSEEKHKPLLKECSNTFGSVPGESSRPNTIFKDHVSAMNIEVVGPNDMRFVDKEHKPPDGNDRVAASNMHMQEDQNGEVANKVDPLALSDVLG
ncbi:hypothetical protein SESBI_12586 [Sesbania bispinosa]|nr:hypothetical protein SESBI_12586 [Sesbania bispinosa]